MRGRRRRPEGSPRRGRDSIIEAPQTGDVVKVEQRLSESSYWAPKLIGGLRLVGAQGPDVDVGAEG